MADKSQHRLKFLYAIKFDDVKSNQTECGPTSRYVKPNSIYGILELPFHKNVFFWYALCSLKYFKAFGDRDHPRADFGYLGGCGVKMGCPNGERIC